LQSRGNSLIRQTTILPKPSTNVPGGKALPETRSHPSFEQAMASLMQSGYEPFGKSRTSGQPIYQQVWFRHEVHKPFIRRIFSIP
jgi:hypothetical protein